MEASYSFKVTSNHRPIRNPFEKYSSAVSPEPSAARGVQKETLSVQQGRGGGGGGGGRGEGVWGPMAQAGGASSPLFPPTSWGATGAMFKGTLAERLPCPFLSPFQI